MPGSTSPSDRAYEAVMPVKKTQAQGFVGARQRVARMFKRL